MRFPGIFTAFSNILLGFFIYSEFVVDWFNLFPLLAASGFLFLAGMTLNDYFDYNIDKNERPNRPLPSGKISRKVALCLGITLFVAANISASFVGFQAVMISVIMTILILAYDIKLKNIKTIGILNLSSIRFLNVILGSSIVLFNFDIIWISIPIAIFVAGISILAKTESSIYLRKVKITNLIFVLFTISYVVVLIHDKGSIHWLILGMFVVVNYLPWMVIKEKSSMTTQKIVTIQLLSIPILDAILVMAFSNVIFAVVTLSMIFPAYVALRKLYLT
ncbi:UbiA family prenyltransferase [Nitrosarchaeum koreense]|uniref:UbiA family prenyltransferase n=1 Tax=Nitrosarchaeum koreense TaxID=1088740 RepID=UPI0012FEF8D5|nr:UbiA family prenyltransferase [Nitrosarchaeum koreense]